MFSNSDSRPYTSRGYCNQRTPNVERAPFRHTRAISQLATSRAGADTGRGGRGRPPLPASWHKAPPQRQTCPFSTSVRGALTALSLLRGALLRTWRATLPSPVASRHLHPHQGALLHTRAPFSTPRRSPPHQSALLHTRVLSCTPGSPTQHQGGLFHTRALSSTPGRPLQHQGALLHIRSPSSTPGCSPPPQDAFLHTWALSSTPGRPPRH